MGLGQSAEKKAALTVLSARHSRLGADSPLSFLDEWQVLNILRMATGKCEMGYKGLANANGLTHGNFRFPMDGSLVCLPIGMSPVLCRFGFHFCPELKNVDGFFPFEFAREHGTVYAEVAAYGTIIPDRWSGKSVASCMQIVRILPEEDVMKAAAEAKRLDPAPPPPGIHVNSTEDEFSNTDDYGRLVNPDDSGLAPAYWSKKTGSYIFAERTRGLLDRADGPAAYMQNDYAGLILPGNQTEIWARGGKYHRDFTDGPALKFLYSHISKKKPLQIYAQNGIPHRPTKMGPAVTFGRRHYIYMENGVVHRDAKDGPAISLPCGLTAYMENGKISRPRKDGPALVFNKPKGRGDWWYDHVLGAVIHAIYKDRQGGMIARNEGLTDNWSRSLYLWFMYAVRIHRNLFFEEGQFIL